MCWNYIQHFLSLKKTQNNARSPILSLYSHYYLLHWDARIIIVSRNNLVWRSSSRMGNRTELCPPSNQSPQTFHLTQANLYTTDLEKSKGMHIWQGRTSRGTGSPIHFYGAAPEGQQAGQEAAESTRELDPPGEVCSTEGTLFTWALAADVSSGDWRLVWPGFWYFPCSTLGWKAHCVLDCVLVAFLSLWVWQTFSRR